MEKGPIVSLKKLAECIKEKCTGFVMNDPELSEDYVRFSLLNPLKEKKPFDLMIAAVPNAILTTIPNITKVEARSPILCAISHTNYECKLGRFGWDPADGEIRFFSEMFFLNAREEDQEDIVNRYVEILPNLLRAFYAGQRQIFHVTSRDMMDEEIVRDILRNGMDKLRDAGILEEAKENEKDDDDESVKI